MAYSVFLSHNSADAGWVNWIAGHAAPLDIQVYAYEQDPQPGLYVATKVQARIDAADALVVLLTQSSQFSAYVQQEIGYAEHARKLIVPLVQPGVDHRALAMLTGREHIPFDFTNPQAGLTTLLAFLQQLSQAKTQARVALFGLGGLLLVALATRDQAVDQAQPARKSAATRRRRRST